jgi:hypothetical protein
MGRAARLARCDAMRCDAMRCDAMRCDAMRCDAMRRKRKPSLRSTMEAFELIINTPVCQVSLGGSIPLAVKMALVEVIAGVKPAAHYLDTVMSTVPHMLENALRVIEMCGLRGS